MFSEVRANTTFITAIAPSSAAQALGLGFWLLGDCLFYANLIL